MELKKGDIVLIEASVDVKGTEIKKTRPAVILSPKEMAEHGKRVLVAPITSNIEKIYPFEFLITSKTLSKPSKASCDQIQTVSIKRIIKKYGSLSRAEIKELEKALKNIFRLK